MISTINGITDKSQKHKKLIFKIKKKYKETNCSKIDYEYLLFIRFCFLKYY